MGNGGMGKQKGKMKKRDVIEKWEKEERRGNGER